MQEFGTGKVEIEGVLRGEPAERAVVEDTIE
jgi:hypothetical protein